MKHNLAAAITIGSIVLFVLFIGPPAILSTLNP